MYEIHHDGAPRFLTVIYYLNGEALTWFPFARVGDLDPCDSIETETSPQELREQFAKVRQGVEDVSMNVGNDLQPGSHGVVVASRSSLDEDDLLFSGGTIMPIDQGDVLAFYNYEYIDEDEGEPRENWRALHAGLPAEQEKVIANHWFRLSEDDPERPLSGNGDLVS